RNQATSPIPSRSAVNPRSNCTAGPNGSVYAGYGTGSDSRRRISSDSVVVVVSFIASVVVPASGYATEDVASWSTGPAVEPRTTAAGDGADASSSLADAW